ncbi:VanW family protein [Bacillus sp. 1P06AnD]|uniref:VanW family protein n=1 Tax=Bacillus sp. 1P06AnD TaxID=3132208 RepID=UPI0039A2B516
MPFFSSKWIILFIILAVSLSIMPPLYCAAANDSALLLSPVFPLQENKKKVQLYINGHSYHTTLNDLGLHFDFFDLLKESDPFGESASIPTPFAVTPKYSDRTHYLGASLNMDKWKNTLTSIEQLQENKMHNATLKITGGTRQLTDHTTGIKIRRAELLSLLNNQISSGKELSTIQIPADPVKPTITKESLKQIDALIGTFSTQYTVRESDSNRNINIALATNAIDSTILMPGEEFSFNKHIGNTTKDKGYQKAGSYLEGEVISSYGGGVCQVSTTLFNALIKAGIIPTTRSNHSMAINYVPIGHDAAIAFPFKDLIFKNPYSIPIYIEGIANNGWLTFKIHSSNTVKASNIEYRLTSEILAEIKPNITFIESTALRPGRIKQLASGKSGYRSATFLETYINGKKVAKTRLYTDFYKPRNEIVMRGKQP